MLSLASVTLHYGQVSDTHSATFFPSQTAGAPFHELKTAVEQMGFLLTEHTLRPPT